MTPEGWYVDPFEGHAQRWFSDGQPTDLVRDAGVEAHDPPPVDHYEGELTEAQHEHATDGQDLLRADDASSQPYAPDRAVDAALDAGAVAGLASD